MRALFILMALTAALGPRQQAPAENAPKKGDTVVVRGCLSGPVLESTEMAVVDAEEMLASAVTFRLTGDKKLLKQMRNEEDGRVVEVIGALKSELPNARRGKQIGKARIVVGVGTPHTMTQQAPPHLPVLEVKSYERVGVGCGG